MIDAVRPARRDAEREAGTTLQEFVALTSTVPTSAFRRAVLSVLAVEVPRDPLSFAGFYGQVLSELGVQEERCVAAEHERRGSEVRS